MKHEVILYQTSNQFLYSDAAMCSFGDRRAECGFGRSGYRSQLPSN